LVYNKIKRTIFFNGYLKNAAVKLSNPFKHDAMNSETFNFKNGKKQVKYMGS
jgi:hypothetical protein